MAAVNDQALAGDEAAGSEAKKLTAVSDVLTSPHATDGHGGEIGASHDLDRPTVRPNPLACIPGMAARQAALGLVTK